MSKTMMEGNKTKGGSFGLSYPMLDLSNYTDWALKMKVFMQAHAVWDVVERSDPKGAIDERNDKIALAMIYEGIHKNILLSIAEKKTDKGAWEAINTMCLGVDRVKKARVWTLKAKFEALSMSDIEQLDDFYMKLNGLVSTIQDLGKR